MQMWSFPFTVTPALSLRARDHVGTKPEPRRFLPRPHFIHVHKQGFTRGDPQLHRRGVPALAVTSHTHGQACTWWGFLRWRVWGLFSCVLNCPFMGC